MKKSNEANPNPRVAVIGAGMCGIAMAVALQRAGIADYTVFEAAHGIGGTWRSNVYPGAAVDVLSSVYQYSFHNRQWTSTHASQAELLDYLEETIRMWNIEQHIRTGVRIEEAVWDEDAQLYRLHHGDQIEEFDILAAATGFLINPHLPRWPGMARFQGEIMHTARWNSSIDLRDKRVAVVGVGSSSAQVVPAIAAEVHTLTVFQREPGWVVPKNGRVYTNRELTERTLWRRLLERWSFAVRVEYRLLVSPSYIPGTRTNRKAETRARRYIDTVFCDRPDLRDSVTPNYPFGGKRRVQSDDFYPALLRSNVRLVPHAVQDLTSVGVIDASGEEHEVDVVVLATGFTAWKYLEGLRVVGRKHRELHDVWDKGAFALTGMTVPGFPNFFILYGPNTNGAGLISVNMLAEQQAARVVRDLRRMRRRGSSSLDTDLGHTTRYNNWLQRRLGKTAWATTSNYTKDPASGRIVTQFHGPSALYWALLQASRLLSTRATTRPVPGARKFGRGRGWNVGRRNS